MKKERRRGFMRQSIMAMLLVLTLVLALQTAMTASAADLAAIAPSDLSVIVNVTSIYLAWKDNSSGEAVLEIERKINDGEWRIHANIEAYWGDFHDTQVIAGATYTYRVRAVLTTFEDGVELLTYSEYSNEVSGAIDAVAAPYNLTGTLAANKITLTWEINSDKVRDFTIQKLWADQRMADYFVVEGNVTSFVDTDFVAGHTYSYYMTASIYVDEYGIYTMTSEPSNMVNVIVPLNYTPTTNSYTHFIMTRPYTSGMFVDVNEDAWYGSRNEKAVASVYEKGLMAGYPDQTFKPDGNLSIAEAITIATRVNSIYSTGFQLEFDPIPDAPWYQGNINYAIEKGIIEAGVFEDYTSIATRGQMAYIFAHTLPDPDEAYRHRYQLNLPPDVDESTPFNEEIMMLYRAGIVGGSDSLGTFHPNSNVTRAQAAAIITRLVDYDARLGDTWYYPGWTS